jgi:hypothetical protein
MPRYPIVRTALAWNLANLATSALRRFGVPYVWVRYEDLVRYPRSQLDRVFRTLDLPPGTFEFLHEGEAVVTPSHTVSGNPMRLVTGTVQIRPDDEWMYRMSRPSRAVVTTMTWPLLRAYGYGKSAGPTWKGREHL